jgi:hypothetical protein
VGERSARNDLAWAITIEAVRELLEEGWVSRSRE